ncbi:MAG TPA: putative oxidoreductase C-terminal domain-containing protein [Ohtaekwangia sp.]|nr:putative oxidoreductase C-terminal domain-containing protein [Ohtaekwangia sp.]
MSRPVQLITLDPGHFHAALVQKTMYDDVDRVVHVYAPQGHDVALHLNRIDAYNHRDAEPTTWRNVVYTGPDFLEKMVQEKAGNVVVLSGNNQKKAAYIRQSLDAGLNVLADKPMAIRPADFESLQESFKIAANKNLLLYDIMTERYEITTMLQRELSMLPEIFGTLETGTPDNPAITKESVHHFYKYVSGSVLTRPAWFFDVAQQGEGIADVMTHLVDLVQWECFPGQVLDYANDVQVNSARQWMTDMTLKQFSDIAKLDSFPHYLQKDVSNDTVLKVRSNGEIHYRLRGVHAKTSVTWKYRAPEGSGDTHYSIMRGTKSNLVIRQGEKENYKPVLYIEPVNETPVFESVLADQIRKIQQMYPGIGLRKLTTGWSVTVPEKYNEGHEAHFARVTEKFLEYLKNGNMPAWEVPNMIAKYYTTMRAVELSERTP